MARKNSPELFDFEQQLKSLSIVDPNDDYVRRSLSAISSIPNKSEKSWRQFIIPALSVCLVVSLSINVFQSFNKNSNDKIADYTVTETINSIGNSAEHGREQSSQTAFPINSVSYLPTGNNNFIDNHDHYTLGEHYSYINAPFLLEGDSAVEVSYLFWYGCYPCYAFDPLLEDWESKLPSNVEVKRMPMIFNATMNSAMKNHARAYYLAQSLPNTEAVHKELFQAISASRNSYNSATDLAPLFIQHGVNADEFFTTFDHPDIQHKVENMSSMAQQLIYAGVNGTPALIINGHYLVKNDSFENMLNVADFLIAQTECEQLSDRPGDTSSFYRC